MIYKVSPSEYLAVHNARGAVEAGESIDLDTARHMLSVINALLGSTRTRVDYIGVVQEWMAHMIEEQHVELLPEEEQGRLVELFAAGALLKLDDTGFRGQW